MSIGNTLHNIANILRVFVMLFPVLQIFVICRNKSVYVFVLAGVHGIGALTS